MDNQATNTETETLSHCLGDVRWHEGKLQQLFEIVQLKGKAVVSAEQAWRDVPTTNPVSERV
jgi:hypothetical protein